MGLISRVSSRTYRQIKICLVMVLGKLTEECLKVLNDYPNQKIELKTFRQLYQEKLLKRFARPSDFQGSFGAFLKSLNMKNVTITDTTICLKQKIDPFYIRTQILRHLNKTTDSPKKQKIIERINLALKDLVELGLDNAHILDLVKNKLDDIRQ